MRFKLPTVKQDKLLLDEIKGYPGQISENR